MKLAQIVLALAGVTAGAAVLLAVGPARPLACADLLGAAIYLDQYCFQTPGVPWPSQCGCPIPNTPSDICSAVIPPNGGSFTVSIYYCTAWTGLSCQTGAKSCGKVWNCNFDCNHQGPPPASESSCSPTDKGDCCTCPRHPQTGYCTTPCSDYWVYGCKTI
jgi:hypothetical protein